MNSGWRNSLVEKAQERFPFLKKLPLWAWWLIALAALGIVIALTSTTPVSNGAIAESPLDSVALGVGVILKLAAVIILIYAAAYGYRHWRGVLPARTARRLSVIETTHLSPRQALHLVRVGERLILIGATDQNLNFITDVETTSAVALNTNPTDAAQDASQITNGSQDFASIIRNY